MIKIKEFFEINGKYVIRLYLNQIVMSVFSLIVIGAASMQSNALHWLASFLAVGLYLFLIYSMMWEGGAKAAAKTLRAEDSGVKKIKTPLLIISLGSAFNIICYILYAFAKISMSVSSVTDGAAASLGRIVWQIIGLSNAIYVGFESLLFFNQYNGMTSEQIAETVGDIPMVTPVYFFFLTLVPLFAVGMTAYYLGGSEISILRKLGYKPKHKATVNKNNNSNRKWFK